MMKLKRITQSDDHLLEFLLPLYEESFPPQERREERQLRNMIALKPEMFFNAIECDGELCGLFVYWEMEDYYYLEHLAVFPSMRNKKIGQQVLDYVRDNLLGIRILEVEPSVDEITTRRVNYYQRNGYQILEKEYMQPSYNIDGEGYPLWIMGNEMPENLPELICRLKQVVYRNNDKYRW